MTRHRCDYCKGLTKDDDRGNCCACGAPRPEEACRTGDPSRFHWATSNSQCLQYYSTNAPIQSNGLPFPFGAVEFFEHRLR